MIKEYEKEYLGKKILITGGMGFIGSNLAHKMVELGAKRIMVVDSLIDGLGGNFNNIKEIKNKIEIYSGKEWDIRNILQMKKLIKDTDYIFNLAGSSKHTKFNEENLWFDSEINFLSQTLFLEACRQVLVEEKNKMTIVFAGTRDQYGKVLKEELPVNEEYTPRKFSDYQSISNNAIEAHHMMLYHTLKDDDNLNVVSARMVNTYGPRQDLNCGAVVPTFLKKILSNEEIELWGGGNILRDFNYIDDVIDGLILLACSGVNGTYNFGCCIGKQGMQNPIGGNLVTIKEFANQLVQIVGKGKIKEILYPDERKTIEPGHCCSDITKISKLGWTPKISLADGLRKSVDWYLTNY